MPCGRIGGDDPQVLVQYFHCRILFRDEIIPSDLWVRNGKIINPEKIFFDEKIVADIRIDCNDLLIVPGFIDVQMNGGFGYDFSSDDLESSLKAVSKGILQHGVTSYCPTIVTSPPDVYQRALPLLNPRPGGYHGAQILGAHIEGPFINPEKKGAHNPVHIISPTKGLDSLKEVFGSLENISIITIAPELPGALDCIRDLSQVNSKIIVSVGHCTSDLRCSEQAFKCGATFITHLFNAMTPFHHRDPGVIGLLTSNAIPRHCFYGIIADNIHTDPTAIRIAYRSHPKGAVAVTDAIAAMCLPPGTHKLGSMEVSIVNEQATLVGTDTLAGSICSMDKCVGNFKRASGCTWIEALQTATLHPAQLLGITDLKGTLDYGSDADFCLMSLSEEHTLTVETTLIAGAVVWMREGSVMRKIEKYFT